MAQKQTETARILLDMVPGPYPQKLLERPRVLAYVGAISSAFTGVEIALVTTYAYLLSTHMPRIAPNQSQLDPVAFGIFESVENLHRRLVLLEKMARARISDASVLGLLGPVVRQVKDAGIKRNQYIHTTWALSKRYEDRLIRWDDLLGPPRYVSEREFKDAFGVIERARVALFEFQLAAMQAIESYLAGHSAAPQDSDGTT